jgi:hypothetical protein
VIRQTLLREHPANAPFVEGLLARLERGERIEGRLSAGHYDVPFANFRVADIERAMGHAPKKEGVQSGR